MATKTHNLAVKVGTYQKDGQEKNRYINVGAVMSSTDNDGNKSTFVLLDRTFNPAGVPNPENKDSVLVSVFEAKQN